MSTLDTAREIDKALAAYCSCRQRTTLLVTECDACSMRVLVSALDAEAAHVERETREACIEAILLIVAEARDPMAERHLLAAVDALRSLAPAAKASSEPKPHAADCNARLGIGACDCAGPVKEPDR